MPREWIGRAAHRNRKQSDHEYSWHYEQTYLVITLTHIRNKYYLTSQKILYPLPVLCPYFFHNWQIFSAHNIVCIYMKFILFLSILYVPVNNFQSCRDDFLSSCKQQIKCLARGHNAVIPKALSLELATMCGSRWWTGGPGISQVAIGILRNSGTNPTREANCFSREVRTALCEIRWIQKTPGPPDGILWIRACAILRSPV